MKLLLEAKKTRWQSSDGVAVRLLVLNDTGEPVTIDRRLLIGPNLVRRGIRGLPFPVSVESGLPHDEQNQIVLNPWCFYGRERFFGDLPPGPLAIHGYYLRRRTDALLPEAPKEAETLLISAEPLLMVVEEGG